MLTKELKRYSLILLLTAILAIGITMPAVKAPAVHLGTVSITPSTVTCDIEDPTTHLFAVNITVDPTGTQGISSAIIAIPDGWTATTVVYIAIATGWNPPTITGGIWTDDSNSTFIRVHGTGGGSGQGTNVEPGQSLYILFTTMDPHPPVSPTTYYWNTTAFVGGMYNSSSLVGVTDQPLPVIVKCPPPETVTVTETSATTVTETSATTIFETLTTTVQILSTPNEAFVFMGAPAGKPFPGPAGTYNASFTDGTAAAIMMGMMGQPIFSFDTNATALDQDQNVGAGGGSLTSVIPVNSTIVASGGPFVNAFVTNYEFNRTAENTPIYFQRFVEGGITYYRWNYTSTGQEVSGTLAEVAPTLTIGPHGTTPVKDYFLIEIFHDANNNQVIIVYGYSGFGTFASTLYFKTVFFPREGSTLTDGYEVVRWDDLNGDTLPDTADAYTILHSSYVGPA